MADDKNIPDGDGQVDGGEDRLKNLQSEYSRKLANMNDQIAAQNQQLAEIANMIASSRQPAPSQAPAGKALKDLVYDDPDAFVEQVVTRAARVADEAAGRRIDSVVQTNTAAQTAIAEVQSRYPEFMQPNSEVAKRAVEIAQGQAKELKGTAHGAKMAMLEAASELGLVPVSKRAPAREGEGDDFSLSGQANGSRGSGRPRSRDPKSEISDTAKHLAELLGVDLNDPKRLEGLEKASKRKSWNRYQ